MTIAIIGASIGQMSLCVSAKEMGLRTICFSWPEGAICKDHVDVFYPISIMEKDLITHICEEEAIDGVVTNASDLTIEISSYIAEKLHLKGNKPEVSHQIKHKDWVRERTNSIEGLSPVTICEYNGNTIPSFPCIVKPAIGSSKKGVSFAQDINDFCEAISYAAVGFDGPILIEQFIPGKEFSVETLSYNGKHFIIQLTDKIHTGPPHFVEIEHHQPSSLSLSQKGKIEMVVPKILDCLGFENGAAHIEMKIDDQDNLYLIEVNPRGGGDHISDTLTRLSTGYDYIKGIIEIAINRFSEPVIHHQMYSGIYFLCQQTSYLLPYFKETICPSWLFEKEISDNNLLCATGNNNRNGFLIYYDNRKILL